MGSRGVDEEVKRVRKAVDAINQLKPSFVIVCGDLINAHRDIYEGLEEQTELDQVSTFKAVMSQIHDDIPLVCVCGNHDVGNRPTPEYIDRYKARFGDDYFSFALCGVKFIVLNNQLYSDPSAAPDSFSEQHEWFEDELRRASIENARHIVVFCHIPWFINKADEPKSIPKRRARGADWDASFVLPYPAREKTNGAPVDALLWRPSLFHWTLASELGANELGNQSGHHLAAGMPLDSDDKWGYRIVKVWEDRLEHKYFESDDEVPRVGFDEEETPGWSCLQKHEN
eukprot:CAMPEP_0184752486 /NCGR_PEP_ID=MMETSP0315-20130426/43600_1 /TAXON_ID=101924 /ORGANISM="Rhodosorus marinus, Strain UTEX LB 2760" /LENGTH=284 /DNA_ID=CAMNT_0027231815 /DNA_START=583 /DNA_END=1438 /DNA_ORIENTATION=+